MIIISIQILIVLLSFSIGSFLNVCIYRIPKKESIVYGSSHCMACNHKLKWYDLIPVLSYIFLRGKCRNCGAKISIQYPLIELSNGAAYLWIYFVNGLNAQTFIYWAFASALIVIFMIDLRHQIIPNSINLFILVIGIINVILNYHQWLFYVIGFFAASLPLIILSIIFKGKLGGGDIKLMAVSGLILGWKIVLGLFIGAIIGSVIGIGLIVSKKIERKTLIPFGPFLTIGLFISMLYGEQFLHWYIALIIN